jgi:hypothetical protein
MTDDVLRLPWKLVKKNDENCGIKGIHYELHDRDGIRALLYCPDVPACHGLLEAMVDALNSTLPKGKP